jgi:hypothetical protein
LFKINICITLPQSFNSAYPVHAAAIRRDVPQLQQFISSGEDINKQFDQVAFPISIENCDEQLFWGDIDCLIIMNMTFERSYLCIVGWSQCIDNCTAERLQGCGHCFD